MRVVVFGGSGFTVLDPADRLRSEVRRRGSRKSGGGFRVHQGP